MAVPQASIQRARRAIGAWLSNRAKMELRADPGIPKEANRKATQYGRKQQLKTEVIERYNLLEPPEEGIQRVWTEGSHQKGANGKQ